MLSEVAVAGIYLPPLFVYALMVVPLFLGMRFLIGRSGLLRWIWHPGLLEFAISVCLLSLLVLYV